MPPRLTDAARRLLARQRNVMAFWQAPSVGMTPRALRASTGSWRRIGPRTVLAGVSEPDPGQKRVAGCLEVGSTAVLGGVAALQEHGWRHDGDGKVDVVTVRGSRASRRELPCWVRLHYSDLAEVRLGAVPLATPPREVIDASAWARKDREATFIIASALQQRLTTPTELGHTVRQRRRIKRAQLLRSVVAEFVAGAHSMGELDFIRECRRRGLPEPQRQVRRRDASGRVRFTDAEFRSSTGRTIIVEIDGVGHMTTDQWLADMQRHNDLALATGALVLRVSAWELRHDPEPFFVRLDQALS